MQPFRGTDLVVIERRFPDGTLDLRGEPQPPIEGIRGMTFDKLYDMYFRETENASPRGLTATWQELEIWLNKKGWKIRAKTW